MYSEHNTHPVTSSMGVPGKGKGKGKDRVSIVSSHPVASSMDVSGPAPFIADTKMNVQSTPTAITRNRAIAHRITMSFCPRYNIQLRGNRVAVIAVKHRSPLGVYTCMFTLVCSHLVCLEESPIFVPNRTPNLAL